MTMQPDRLDQILSASLPPIADDGFSVRVLRRIERLERIAVKEDALFLSVMLAAAGYLLYRPVLSLAEGLFAGLAIPSMSSFPDAGSLVPAMLALAAAALAVTLSQVEEF